MSVDSGNRYVALDAMRGVAALSVVLFHISHEEGIQYAFRGAYLAVDFFFALSGFVLASVYEPRLRSTMRVSEFMGIRLIRVWPMIALGASLGAVAAFQEAGGATHDLPWAWLRHMVIAPDFSNEILFSLNIVQWSLFLEIAINLFHALAVRALSDRVLVCLVAAAFAYLVYVVVTNGSASTGWGAAGFDVGAARIAFSYPLGVLIFRWMKAGRLRPPATSLFVPILIVTPVFAAPEAGVAYTVIRDLLAIAVLLPAALLLGTAARTPRWLTDVAPWLGAISYPLYAIHYPLLELLGSSFVDAPLAKWMQAAAWSAVLVVCLLAAWAAGRWIDTPIRALLDNVMRPRLAGPEKSAT